MTTFTFFFTLLLFQYIQNTKTPFSGASNQKIHYTPIFTHFFRFQNLKTEIANLNFHISGTLAARSRVFQQRNNDDRTTSRRSHTKLNPELVVGWSGALLLSSGSGTASGPHYYYLSVSSTLLASSMHVCACRSIHLAPAFGDLMFQVRIHVKLNCYCDWRGL